MHPAEEVQVESCQSHDWVVEILLVGNQEIACGIPYKLKVVEGGKDRLHVGRRCREERDVLDIRVVLRHVGNEMVHVVAGFPPADAEAAAKVCDESTNESIGNKVSCDSAVTSIMGCEHDLLLQMD